MNRVLKLAGCLFGLIAASPALAVDQSANGDFTLTAQVESFCRLSYENTAPVAIANGAAALGQVREVCNSGNGYVVHGAFSNLREANVRAGTDVAAVQQDGTFDFARSMARKQATDWQISDAAVIDANAPVYMTLTISPL